MPPCDIELDRRVRLEALLTVCRKDRQALAFNVLTHTTFRAAVVTSRMSA